METKRGRGRTKQRVVLRFWASERELSGSPQMTLMGHPLGTSAESFHGG